jgi:tetratricopeptide (TPR) repeat protein
VIEAEIERAKGLMGKRQFAQALALSEGLLEQVPDNRDVLYLVAVNQRYLGRLPDALKTLAHFETLHPDYGRLFQELGHCHRTLGDSDAAIAAYQHAVNLNPSLPASWKALVALYRAAGRSADADNAANVAATEGSAQAAEQIIRPFLMQNPQHVEGMRLLARIGMKMGVLDDAEFLLQNVLELSPDYHAARHNYAEVLADRHKHLEALEQIRKLLQVEPRNPVFRALEGNALVGLGRHDEALRIFFELREETPTNPTLHLAIAHALKTVGRQAEAIDAYRRAAEVGPSYGDPYWSLANLKTYRFADEEIARMRKVESDPRIALVDRYHFYFALGKALEDRGEYAQSFHFYSAGNALKKAEARYDRASFERNARRQMQVCTREFFAARRDWGSPAPDPIFIVGLPRAGSTLLEQILASHSAVEGTKELAEIPRLVHELTGRESADYPDVLATLTSEQVRQFGERFLADTRIYRSSGRPFFIDKMPNNFRHVGLIHLILPNAKIIDARREPMACCFSNFKQLFANGQEFTYSLEDIGRYYRTYVELMQHWDAVLPGKVLRMQHEVVVEDLEGSVRQLLEFCGLPFEAACLEFWKTERNVRTASSEQVRRPIFKEGLDQWRHFEPWLGPLKEALS